MKNPSNPPNPSQSGNPTPSRGALRPDEAARYLGIGVRKLWELTNRKMVPHCRIGRRLVYPVDALDAWLKSKTQGGGA